jgi:hypothetical protein
MCDTLGDAYEMADLLSEVVSCKKATIVVVLFVYLAYLALVAFIHFQEYKKNTDNVEKLKAIKLDVEQRQFFILAIALLTQIITPVPFPVVMLYLYIALLAIMVLGHIKQDKWIIYMVAMVS